MNLNELLKASSKHALRNKMHLKKLREGDIELAKDATASLVNSLQTALNTIKDVYKNEDLFEFQQKVQDGLEFTDK